MNFKLYKISNQRILGGVCAGIADSAGIDPTIIRIVSALLCIYLPFLILIYLLLIILLPEKAAAFEPYTQKQSAQCNTNDIPHEQEENINNNFKDSETFTNTKENSNPLKSGNFHASNMIFAVILICGGIGLFITRVVFNYAIGFDDFITFIVFGVGIFLLISGLMEDKNSHSVRSTKITLGIILSAISFTWILNIFGYVILTMNDLISSIKFLWPLFIIAIGMNILLPNKKATLAIWFSIAVIIILVTIYRSMYGMLLFV